MGRGARGRRLSPLAPHQYWRNPSGLRFIRFPPTLLTHGFPGEFDAEGVVDQSVENAIGDCRIADLLVPVSDGHLGSKDDGSPLIAVIADFQKVAALSIFQRSHGEVIEYENVNARE